MKSPTLNKLDDLCEVMDVHPLTLLTLAYVGGGSAADKLLARVQRELADIEAREGRLNGQKRRYLRPQLFWHNPLAR